MSFLNGNNAEPVPSGVYVSSRTLWIGIIVAVFVVGIIVFWWFRPVSKDVTVMGPYVLNSGGLVPSKDTIQTVLTHSQIESSLGNNFTLSFFVYMDDVNRERIPIAGPKGDFRFKPFLYILGVGDIVLDPIHQVARLRIKPLTRNAIRDRDALTNHDIENFMIARWNQITFTITGRTVDVYLNGAIATSSLLENVPVLYPVGVLIETSPDFTGQAGLFQAWPRRLTETEIMENYKRNTDTRGKPRIPDSLMKWKTVWDQMKKTICAVGLCGFHLETGPMQYIDYEYA